MKPRKNIGRYSGLSKKKFHWEKNTKVPTSNLSSNLNNITYTYIAFVSCLI